MAFDRNKKADPDKKEAFHNNPYLQEPRQGLRLLASLISANNQAGEQEVDRLVDKLAASCSRLPIARSGERFGKIRQLVQLLKNPLRERVLTDCTIVGVAGQFSTGKSSLINSLLRIDPVDKDVLPVASTPATSVPAYLLFGKKEKITACTSNGKERALDSDQLWALSHAFAQAHKINPAQFLDFVAIEHPNFPLNGIALLDTPGFDKSDKAKISNFADRDRTKNALGSADHLIWLINPSSATELTSEDISFLNDLKPSGQLTIIVNKAKSKPEIGSMENDADHCPELEHIRNTCRKKNIKVDNMFAYEPWDPEWNHGREKLLAVLQGVSKKDNVARSQELCNLIDELKHDVKSCTKNLYVNEIESINFLAEKSFNPPELAPLVEIRGMMGIELANMKDDQEKFSKYATALLAWAKRE